ncbi:hypothetical protein E0H26_24105 [Micromonospora zingiberis]|uniref:Uncharacterized protein n=1 Tax=Micromonospora zingiberis TaxID=2053011 RepID=A0A4R0GBM3_9ACTN|nr:hypothetical protein [Micromonospora zingiberis]TCB92728.1 hypothetical protein E0H26_24105 [Micromonospora zingiberis]
MTHDLPIPRQDDRTDGPSIVQWGTEDEEPAGTGRLRQALAGLGRDHRVPLLLAGLGTAAALASLLGEWVTVTIPTGGADSSDPVEMPSSVSEIGGLGIGYLVGMLVLGATVALALRGTVAVRPNARVAGFALAVGLLAVLVATAVSLDDGGRRAVVYSGDDGFSVEFGRGLIMAFVAVLLFAAALARTSSGPDGSAAAEPGRRQPRPRRQAEEADEQADRPPIDITVTPTVPFAREARPD